jgi:hypothetical protein
MAYDSNQPISPSNNPANDPNYQLTPADVAANKAAADRKARGQ